MICCMAKASHKNRKSTKRLNPAKFNIVEATAEDVNRYLAARSRFDGCKPFWRKMGFTPDADSLVCYHKLL